MSIKAMSVVSEVLNIHEVGTGNGESLEEIMERMEVAVKHYAKHHGRDIRHRAAELANEAGNTELHRDIMNIQIKPE